MGQIRHDHVVTIHDSGHTEDGRPYIAMEYLEGEDLASYLKQHGPMSSSRAMLLWRQAVSAVAAAHRREVVHRDLKPANLFLTSKEGDEGPEEIIKVIDFSIAKLVNPGREPRPTEPGAIVGTVLYMAPEQLESNAATPRSDVYSLGLVLVEMLTGRLPWAAAAGEKATVGNALLRLVTSPTTLRELQPEQPFSEELLQLASDVLSRDPAQRPVDASALLRRIRLLPEMREWQRLPRRLSWPAHGEPTATTGKLVNQPVGGAAPSAGRPADDPDLPTDSGASQTEQNGDLSAGLLTGDAAGEGLDLEPTAADDRQPHSTWSINSSGVPEVNDDWAEPTIPAGEAESDYDLHALVATLVADSRQARDAGGQFSSDTRAPLFTVSGVSVGEPTPASLRSLIPEDSNSSANGAVWTASDLDQRLHAHDRTPTPSLPMPPTPVLLAEEPAVPTASAVAIADSQVAATAPVSAVLGTSAVPVPIVDSAAATHRYTLAPRPAAPRRVSRFVINVAVVTGIMGLLILWFRAPRSDLRQVPDLRSIGPVGVTLDSARANVADLAERDRMDGAAPDANPADLAAPDLAPAGDLLASLKNPEVVDAGTEDAAPLIRVRFVYTDGDGISALDCDPLQGPAKHVVTPHKFTVKVTLGPGARCTVSGARGSRVYTYEQVARIRPDHSGEIRFHVRGSAAAGPADLTPTPPASLAPSPGAEPPPPALEVSPPVAPAPVPGPS